MSVAAELARVPSPTSGQPAWNIPPLVRRGAPNIEDDVAAAELAHTVVWTSPGRTGAGERPTSAAREVGPISRMSILLPSAAAVVIAATLVVLSTMRTLEPQRLAVGPEEPAPELVASRTIPEHVRVPTPVVFEIPSPLVAPRRCDERTPPPRAVPRLRRMSAPPAPAPAPSEAIVTKVEPDEPDEDALLPLTGSAPRAEPAEDDLGLLPVVGRSTKSADL